MVVKTNQRTRERESFAVGGEDSWVNNSGWGYDESYDDEDYSEDDEDHSDHDLKFMFHIQIRGL